jgi:glycosyltransferase involved in cell wall biosynthesis
MNRLVCSSADEIPAAKLPPERRAPGGPVRVLFLHTMEVGFATTAGSLEHFAGVRDDIDAVHVRLIMPGWLRLLCKQSPVPIGELDYRYLRHMLFWRMHLKRLVGRGKKLPLECFDVVHIMTQQRAGMVPGFVARRERERTSTGHGHAEVATKFVINLDATLRNWESMRHMKRLAPPIDWALEGRILRSADMVACASNWVAESCERFSGVDSRRIVIHKPCAIVRETDQTIASSVSSSTSGLKRLLFVGGNWIDKGGPRLLEWHQRYWKDRAELHIVSAGVPAIQAMNVIVHGRVDRDVLVDEMMPRMDVFVVPTKWDTFMIAAQEAMSAGLPVVTTRTGALAEVVRDGGTGFLCPHDDDQAYIRAVDRLLGDEVLSQTMSTAAREHARRNLSASVWHNHLLDQIVALANNVPFRAEPETLARASGREKVVP